MEIGNTLYVTSRKDWRSWLKKHHNKAGDIWLIFYNKKSGKPRLPYDEAVEEALCFGWIDSIVKKIDIESTAQRFSPRRKKSQLSALNRVRLKKMIAQGKMTQAGIDSLSGHLQFENGALVEFAPFAIPDDIHQMLKSDPALWKNFSDFPEEYKQVRIGYIDSARVRPEEFTKRLNNFIKMTRQGKMFGSWK
jgi:uncharacterized protein YdeI (YjbR/CyaY-like superfamily)